MPISNSYCYPHVASVFPMYSACSVASCVCKYTSSSLFPHIASVLAQYCMCSHFIRHISNIG